MATLVQQIDGSYGEVDDILFTDTSQQEYLQAFRRCRNAYISSHKIPKRRPSFADATLSLIPDGIVRKTISFESQDGKWYALFLRKTGVSTTTEIVLTFYSLDSQGIRVPTEEHVLSQDSETEIEEYDLTATDNYVVIAHPAIPPRKVQIDSTDISSSTIEDIAFSVVPSLDTGDISYSSYTFEPKCTGGGNPSGDPPVCPTGQVFGAIIDVVRPNSGDPQFSTDWVGGLIVGQTGASTEQPIGFGLIDGITTLNATTQRFSVTVLQAFGAQNYSTAGEAWSVRKPVWGPRVSGTPVYPSKVSFFKGRLWFANTPEQPMLIAGSRENTPNDFNVGQGDSPDAICYLSNDSQGGGILHVFGGRNLHIFTSQQQLVVQGGLDVGIDAGNFNPQVVDNFSTSSLKPVVYREGVYFTTSDGKGLVKVVEDDRSVSATLISSNSESLIRNPSAIGVVNIPDTQDQIIAALNSDGTVTVYSYDANAGVQAFSLYEIGNVAQETIVDLFVIDNRLHIVSSANRYSFSSNRVDFDFYHAGTITNGILPVNANIPPGQEIQITYTTNVDGNTNDNYLGIYEVLPDNTVDTGNPSLNAGARYGIKFVSVIQSLSLYSSAQGSFLKRRIHRVWCQFFESYNFTFNGTLVATQNSAQVAPPGSSPYRVTGTARKGFSGGYQQDNFITLIQETPYPMTIQKIAWAVTEKVII